MKCSVVKADNHAFSEATERLKAGKLVAFPTETVYGLGANALDPEAVLRIFDAKKRPLTDPLIVHIYSFKDINELVQFKTQRVESIVNLLAKTFWPGPLTLVLPATDRIPELITASTGLVGIRIPDSKVAIELLKTCQLPIAAPSANRFGHVSPTTAAHVFNDLNHYDLMILEQDSQIKVGIESTVLKVEDVSNEIALTVFRKGGVSVSQLKKSLESFTAETGIKGVVRVVNKQVKNKAEPSPGQELTHYAPELQTFLLNQFLTKLQEKIDVETENRERFSLVLKQTVFIDFNETNVHLKNDFLEYFDLSPIGDISEAARNVYKTLRLAERVENAEYCFIFNLKLVENEKVSHPERINAIFDRIYRSASGKMVKLV